MPYKNKIETQMNEIIAYSDTILTKEGVESSLANFVMESMEMEFKQLSYDTIKQLICMINRGGLRNNLPKGDIKIGTIFEIMPFDNEIVILKISGKKLTEAINSFCENGKLFSSHIQFRIDHKKAINIHIGNIPINENEAYYILTSDYLAAGGDNSGFFAHPSFYQNTGVKVRDAMINYCRFLTKNKTTIKSKKDGRITKSE